MNFRISRRILRAALWISVAIGGTVAAVVLVTEVRAWRSSQARIPLLPQFGLYLDSPKSNFQAFVRSRDSARYDRCVALLVSLGLDTIAEEPQFSSADTHIVDALASDPCLISGAPNPVDIDWLAVGSAFAGTSLLSLIVLTAVASVVTYAHVGWRRIATLAGVIGVLIGGLVEHRDSDEFLSIIAVAFGCGILGSVSALLLRECVLWVKAGFRDTGD